MKYSNHINEPVSLLLKHICTLLDYHTSKGLQMHTLKLKRNSLRRFDDLKNEFEDSKISRTTFKPLQSQVASFFKSKTKHS